MKRILINATHNEEIRVALCKGNHLYDFDLENRTREQKKANIYKGRVTRVEPSLEAVFVEYGSERQGFLPMREIAASYLNGNPREETNIRKLIREGDELIVQVEKEERGNKGAALSTYISLAGRYLVLMPNNSRGGGISRQISGKLREDMKAILASLDLPKGMSVIVRTAGIGKSQEELRNDLDHLLSIWQSILEQNRLYPSPRLVYQEAGVVTRAVRDYLRDDIAEIWVDNENAYFEAESFIQAMMPAQVSKLRKYTDFEPMFARFGIEKQIETAYQREVRLPSGGSIVIDQTEALVSIDINSAKSTKGSDVAETAYHTNLEAADEIARQLRLRDMGGLIVIDFIDMADSKHQKDVEKRLIEATKYDRARVQFGEISKFGLMEMSRQRLRPSLEESTGYICPRCHGNGMIRDLRSLSLSIMRQIEQIALKERQGEVQAEVPTDIAAFLLNEKRESLVYLEQDSGTRITILPHAHLESPNFNLHFNRDGFAPSSYERVSDTQQQEHNDRGYEVDWQTKDTERTTNPHLPKSQPNSEHKKPAQPNKNIKAPNNPTKAQQVTTNKAPIPASSPQMVAWLSNLFAPAPEAKLAHQLNTQEVAQGIEHLVNSGANSLGSMGVLDHQTLPQAQIQPQTQPQTAPPHAPTQNNPANTGDQDNKKPPYRKPKPKKYPKKPTDNKTDQDQKSSNTNNLTNQNPANKDKTQKPQQDLARRPANSERPARAEIQRGEAITPTETRTQEAPQPVAEKQETTKAQNNPANNPQTKGQQADSATQTPAKDQTTDPNPQAQKTATPKTQKPKKSPNPQEVGLKVYKVPHVQPAEVIHLSLDDSKVRAGEPTKTEVLAVDIEAKTAQNALQATPHNQPMIQDDSTEPAIDLSDDLSENAPTISTGSDQITLNLDLNIDQDQADSPSEVVKPLAENTDPNLAFAIAFNQEINNELYGNKKSDGENPSDPERDPNPQTQDPTIATSATEDTAIAADQTPIHVETATSTSIGDNASDHTHDDPSADKSELPLVDQNSLSKDESQNKDAEDIDSANLNLADQNVPWQDLFADCYITAHRYGQAPNDPRRVQKQYQANLAQANPSQTIFGTVGEFIQKYLPQAEDLAEESIITRFIQALANHQAHAKQDLQNGFDFSNYGYPPLAPSYLEAFHAQIQAKASFATPQGKTQVDPLPIAKRAKNDPRGQYPQAQNPQVQTASEHTPPAPKQSSDQSDQSVSDTFLLPSTALEMLLNLGDVSSLIQNENVKDMEAASSNHVEMAETQTNSDHIDLNSEFSQPESFKDETTEQIASQTSEENGQNNKPKTKTTAEVYKNMIESVAAQLLDINQGLSIHSPILNRPRKKDNKDD